MKIKIGVLDNPIYARLYSELDTIKTKYDIELYKLDEKSLTDLFFARRVDLALLTPLGYAKGVKKADFRIIPTNALSAIGYTQFASTYYNPKSKNLTKLGSPTPNDFVMEIGRILLAERYDLVMNTEKSVSDLPKAFENFDVVLKQGKEDFESVSMDITEDWFDSYQMPLPMAFWVCYSDELEIPMLEITKGLANLNDKFEELHLNNANASESELMWHWDEDVFNSTEQVMQLLFFHKILNEVPAVKIYQSAEAIVNELETGAKLADSNNEDEIENIGSF